MSTSVALYSTRLAGVLPYDNIQREADWPDQAVQRKYLLADLRREK